ncbi:acyl-CoA dehydrogenase family protein [Pedococcus sp. 5OH_020]|uniref:acyl-CoA dehydrogenase family protein n=1 Tax=Pedococcus sp. 5OH_020 TaxID=2989814 RepID=UPI0022E9AA05|nr:acyl-CoA dehydrogenase family protein [Pedococcus sp. 5OH_020]
MSTTSPDLEQFLEVVSKVATSVATGAVADGWTAVESAGLPSLARDTAEEPDALHWLAHTVRVAAGSFPALAFVLAARYAADLALGEDSSQAPTFALRSHFSDPVVVIDPVPDLVVLLDIDNRTVETVTWAEVEATVRDTPRTGLAAVRWGEFAPPSTSRPTSSDPTTMLTPWDLLTGAALIGIAERAVALTQAYVLERKQFGVPIGSFAGLRALVAGMALRVEPVRAQLDRALDGLAPSDTVVALAGPAAVHNCLDAIQSHGGYGYIAEYPIAGLLRDAMSVQARSGGRRLHVARVAQRGLGDPAGARS